MLAKFLNKLLKISLWNLKDSINWSTILLKMLCFLLLTILRMFLIQQGLTWIDSLLWTSTILNKYHRLSDFWIRIKLIIKVRFMMWIFWGKMCMRGWSWILRRKKLRRGWDILPRMIRICRGIWLNVTNISRKDQRMNWRDLLMPNWTTFSNRNLRTDLSSSRKKQQIWWVTRAK